jgi:hypothetical protein
MNNIANTMTTRAIKSLDEQPLTRATVDLAQITTHREPLGPKQIRWLHETHPNVRYMVETRARNHRDYVTSYKRALRC